MGRVPYSAHQAIKARKPAKTRCQYCQRVIEEADITADHVIPIISGGGHGPDNIIWCCILCNKLKSSTNVEEFLKMVALVPVSHAIPLGRDFRSVEAQRVYQNLWHRSVVRVRQILSTLE